MDNTTELKPTPSRTLAEQDLPAQKVQAPVQQQDQILRPPTPIQHRPAAQAHQPGLPPSAPAPRLSQVQPQQPAHAQTPPAQHQPHVAPTAPARTNKPPRAKAIEQEVQQDEGMSL